MTPGIEPKLLYHVRNFLADWKSRRPPTEDAILETLLSGHREYQRKPQGPLRKQVTKALRWCLDRDEEASDRASNDHVQGGETSLVTTPSSRKRSRQGGRDGSSESDEEHEMEAKKREAQLREQQPCLNLLNECLSVGYKKAQDVKETATTSAANGGLAAPTSENGTLLSSSHDQASSSGPSTGATAASAKPVKRRRRAAPESNSGRPTPQHDGSLPVLLERPSARYSNLAGVERVLQDVRELIEYPLRHPEVYRHLGVEPPRGILLHGPPGCGKTLLANAIAGECGVSFLKISAPEVVSGMSGESEQKVRELFQLAVESAPAIVFIDEVDAITQKRDTSQRGMERRIVAQLLTCLDSLSLENTKGKPVLVVGATNRPDSLDPGLRRAGRFDREIALGVPDHDARCKILEVLTSKMRLSGELDLAAIAKMTPGFVGADLASLTKEAAAVAISRILNSLPTETAVASDAAQVAPSAAEDSPPDVAGHAVAEASAGWRPIPKDVLAGMAVTMDDFLTAVKKVQPSSKREGFAAVPNVTWADVGALASVREELAMSILEPISNPERFEALGLTIPAGVLLFGPPGCGKTLLAKAIASETGANFISVKGPELLDKYVGESERAVRQVFTRARASPPCIIFFDELDALCPRRGSGGDGGGGVSERVVNQLLTEMDGLEGRRNVFVIAATNRPELIDPAMLRPGRLDKLLYVPLPTPDDRVSILRAVCRTVTIHGDVDLEEVGRDPRAEGYSGADLAALVREAGLAVLRALRRSEAHGASAGDGAAIDLSELAVCRRHFQQAFAHVPPSVSSRDQRRYLQIRASMSRARAAPSTEVPGEPRADAQQAPQDGADCDKGHV